MPQVNEFSWLHSSTNIMMLILLTFISLNFNLLRCKSMKSFHMNYTFIYFI